MLNVSSTYITQTYNQSAQNSSSTVASQKNGGPLVSDSSTGEIVTVSARGRNLSLHPASGETSKPANNAGSGSSQQPATAGQTLSYNDFATLKKLQARDKEVRAHEQAHLAAAGQYALSGATFQYQHGPDGRTYAVGGEVSISVGPENSPQATIDKMVAVRRAALAPASPSSADRQIAAQATATLSQARQELQQQSAESTDENPTITDTEGSANSPAPQNISGPEPMVHSNIRTLMVETYSAVNELI